MINFKNKIFILLIIFSTFFIFSSQYDSSCPIETKINQKGQLFLRALQEKGLGHIPLSVIIEVESEMDISKLESLNSEIRFISSNFCTADILVKEFDSLLKLPYVKNVYIANLSKKSAIPYSPKVIIGIIDTGIYWRSRIFFDKDGNNRILYLWDQTSQECSNFSVLPYGSEYNNQQLQNLENSNDLLPDLWGHGAIVASIAAGSAEIKDQYGNLLFQSKELNSGIILVNTTGREDHVLDAVAYIVHKAKQLNANCIINFSYGKHYGPHDGSHLYTRAIDSLLNENCIMIVGIGNDGGKKVYSNKYLENNTTFEFILKDRYDPEDLKDSKTVGLNLDLWFDKNLNITAFLESPREKLFGPINKNEHKKYNSEEGSMLIINSISNSTGKYNEIQITIENNEEQFPQEGVWKLMLQNKSEKKDYISAWITSTKFCDAEFLENNPNTSSISSLAASKKILSVGSYIIDSKNSAYNEAPFSSSGYTLDNRIKPDVFTLSEFSIDISEIGSKTLGGTSASAALITRLIGIIWDMYPEVDASTITNFLNGKAIVFENKEYPWKGKQEYQTTNLSSIFKFFHDDKKSSKIITSPK